MVAVSDGAVLAYIERGGRTVLTFTVDGSSLTGVAAALGSLVEQGRIERLQVESIDGAPALTGKHPLAAALMEADFHQTTRGLRRRR